MKVKKLMFNWYQSGSVTESQGAIEDYTLHISGKHGVLEIVEDITPQGQYTYLVKLEDGSAYRIFNPNSVEYFKQKN